MLRMPDHLKTVRVDADDLAAVADMMNAARQKMGRNGEGGRYRADAGETAIIARQLEYIRLKTTDVVYAESKALKLFKISTDVPDGADSFMTHQWDLAGSAKIISNYADDLPRVAVMAQERAQAVKDVGNSYDYSMRDLKRSAFSGVPLPLKKANAARIVHERTIDELVAFGNANAGLPGALNNANVPLVSPLHGGWATATPAQILADLNELEWSIFTTSKEMFMPNKLAIASTLYKLLNTTMYVAGDVTTTQSILNVFLANSKFIKTVEPWHKLDLADAQSDGPRLFAYNDDSSVIEVVIPRPFTQEAPQVKNLTWVVNCHSSIGGVQVNYPLGTAYMDGVLD